MECGWYYKHTPIINIIIYYKANEYQTELYNYKFTIMRRNKYCHNNQKEVKINEVQDELKQKTCVEFEF